MNNPEEVSSYQDVKLNMNRKGICYSERIVSQYNVKRTRDNMRYGLTEKEIMLLEEFENRISISTIKDVDSIVKKTIVDLMDEEHNMCTDTKDFMYDLAKYGLSEAYANRTMKINILEMSNTCTRLEYLTHVE